MHAKAAEYRCMNLLFVDRDVIGQKSGSTSKFMLIASVSNISNFSFPIGIFNQVYKHTNFRRRNLMMIILCMYT
jgi:hypothetical protein